MESTTPAVRTGELIAGKYRLLERLGVGGMGEVYRATHEAIGRMVAIKLLRPEHASTTETVERLSREARAANLVRHPNVVDVLDFGTDERLGVYLVQELLHGEDLSAHLTQRGGRLPLDETLAILLPVIGGVATAHAAGVIHRDIKPSNVYLNRAPDGTVVPKVLDFGISKIVGLSGRIDVSTVSVTLGTPAYMSPEQIQGEPIEAQSDVWSLGVLLHQMLTGELPFRGDSPGKQYVQICTAPPASLADAAPGTPPEIVAIVSRCLEKSADARYANADELLAAFDSLPFADEARARSVVIGAQPRSARPSGAPSEQSLSPVARSRTSGTVSRRVFGSVAVLLVGVVGVAALALSRNHATRDSIRGAAPPVPTPQVVVAESAHVPNANPVAVEVPQPSPSVQTTDASVSPDAGAARTTPASRPTVRHGSGNTVVHPRHETNPWGVETHY